MTTLAARCAAFGWTLHAQGDGYELLGNGAPAAFSSTESLEAWLEHQERGRRQLADVAAYEQVVMELEVV